MDYFEIFFMLIAAQVAVIAIVLCVLVLLIRWVFRIDHRVEVSRYQAEQLEQVNFNLAVLAWRLHRAELLARGAEFDEPIPEEIPEPPEWADA